MGSFFSGIIFEWHEVEVTSSSQDLAQDLSMNIRQPEITSRIAISQPFMIKSQLVQNGGMQVMNTGWLFDRFESKVIRCAISHSPSNPTIQTLNP